MSVVDRSKALLPPLRKKTVDVPAIGGEVVLQALTLSESLRISMIRGEEGEAARLRIPHMLAVGVLASDGKPLWTVDQWDIFGSVDDNRLTCLELCGGITELSQSEKKALPQT